MQIVQIVPRLGASADGVADYSRGLASALEADQRIATTFLSGDPNDRPDAGASGRRSFRVPARTAAGLAQALAKCGEHDSDDTPPVIALHYVNYGYAARGCPFWLIRGLAQWKRQIPAPRLITIFHELYAFGPPWRSSFWLSPVQRYLAREVWRLTDGAVTTLERYKRQLAAWAPSRERRAAVMPVFSSIREPRQVSGWDDRGPRMIVFGRAGTEQRVYGRHRNLLRTACRALGIEEIIDIGPRNDPIPDRIDNIRVRSTGRLPAGEVSDFMASAKAGFLDYPTDFAGKSTIFAAYAAHAVVPVVTWYRGDDGSGLQEGVHYWAPARHSDRTTRNFAAMAGSARAWYVGHRLDVQVDIFARMLK